MRARIVDVAREAKVSTATVSRTLNGAKVRPEHARAVAAAVQRLGYSPSRAGRALRKRQAAVIALVVGDIENPFFTAMARGVEDVALDNDLSLVLANSDEDPDKVERYLQVVVDERMAGVVICPADTNVDLSPLVDEGVHVVVVDRPTRFDLDHVLLDNESLALQATRDLIARGARRIACLTGPATIPTAVERAGGWRLALEEAALPVEGRLLTHTDFRVAGARRATEQLLGSADPPDALLAANNLVGVGVLQALDACDSAALVAVLGELPFQTHHDQHILVRPLDPALMGRLAAQMLCERINGSHTGPGRRLVLGGAGGPPLPRGAPSRVRTDT
ncbi:LacI family DNA-binding transcriptional regulator [Schaalia sp. 19OD2882]|uniref:LacI family DNA-binding transcriptional regulator n=1 Tax=Schaalia sp. 19OD2882 TaxID=2794089 RepID=UPI001C1EC7C7|nr:LacI family DNA-binding transcriptional regulator [Schaalia sp. 19OD2882]QWW20190.1 LacI family DNA-binding transcriptional regulator [Schaalia sp. 19OD2882]